MVQRIAARVVLVVMLVIGSLGMVRASPPSFPCSAARTYAERAICADPALAALDRQLAATYKTVSAQGGIDAHVLAAQEGVWLTHVRDACTTTSCIAKAYTARNAALLQQSLIAASPAAYADTRPYPTPSRAMALAASLIGRPCAARFRDPDSVFAGFSKPVGGAADFLPVIYRDATIIARQRGEARFAFLLDLGNAGTACKIVDVVALPPPTQATRLLQCAMDDGATLGFGMGRGPHDDVVAGWMIQRNGAHRSFQRQPIHVLPVGAIRCQEPETGE